MVIEPRQSILPLALREPRRRCPSAALYRTASATLDTAVFPHSISIGPPSAATTGGFLLTALSDRNRLPWNACKAPDAQPSSPWPGLRWPSYARSDAVERAFFTVARAALALLRTLGRGRAGVRVRVRCA